MSAEQEVVAAEGTTLHQQAWTLLYRPAGGQHCVRLLVNGSEHDAAWGFDIPEVTEIGFAGGLTPGSVQFFLTASSRRGSWSCVQRATKRLVGPT